MTAPGFRAGVYDRVSQLAKGADARSVKQQNDANTSACKRYGWTVAARYADPGVSASRFARKAREDYQRLLADIKARSLDVTVFWESSRGGRELAAWATLLNECRDHGVKIYITNDDRLYDLARARDWRSLAEDGVDSAYQSEKTADQVNRDMAANAAAGRPHGKVLYGYERIYDEHTKALVEQRRRPPQALIVAEIITRTADGDPLTLIARGLRERGVPTPRGGVWTASRVLRIARNRAYIGRRLYNGAETPAIWPPLVGEPVFWRAQIVLDDPSRTRRRPGAARHLLSYLAACGGCGKSPLEVTSQRGVPYYACELHRCTGIREDWLDEYVLASTAVILGSEVFREHLSRSGDDEVLAARAQADELRAELRENLELAKARKLSPASFAEIEASLLAGIGEAEQRAEAVASPPVLRGLGSGMDVLMAAPLAVRKQALRELFAEITLLPARRQGRQPFDPARVRIVPRWEASGDGGGQRECGSGEASNTT